MKNTLVRAVRAAAARLGSQAPRQEPDVPPEVAAGVQSEVQFEVDHWNRTEQRTGRGERIFWLQHPRVTMHYHIKSLIEGVIWQEWVPRIADGPVDRALELGCGNGQALASLLRTPTAREIVAVDLDESRFAAIKQELGAAEKNVRFRATDINHIELDAEAYDLIYAIQSFHHFENLEHIYAEIHKGLKPGGLCVLEEYVGPPRFQWTDVQLALTRQLLGIMPLNLRIYPNGMEKAEEGRSTVEDVIRFCPSEAIRSDEIVPLFHETFEVLHHNRLGGTIQHLLYSGIIHNFAEDDPATDRVIDSIDSLERAFIEHGVIGSDFVLLVGRKK